MIAPPDSVEGWEPDVAGPADLARVIELAFDYRGDVTVVGRDGSEWFGYLFNRSAAAPDPYVELLDPAGDAPVRVRCADIRTIRFTGRDTAAGKSYAAWLERKAAAKDA
ncbi:MAG: hypothetical protein HYU41_22375 [Candidatus Rokubacteria bacterium]|nr:hypothetical protein [Candidatus Rokubacteria bacterium]